MWPPSTPPGSPLKPHRPPPRTTKVCHALTRRWALTRHWAESSDHGRWRCRALGTGARGQGELDTPARNDIPENTIHNYNGVPYGNVAPVVGAIRVSELKSAMRRDLVNGNVAELVQTHRSPKAERFGLTVKQARCLLDAATGDRLENLLIVVLLLGLRPSPDFQQRGQHLALPGVQQVMQGLPQADLRDQPGQGVHPGSSTRCSLSRATAASKSAFGPSPGSRQSPCWSAVTSGFVV